MDKEQALLSLKWMITNNIDGNWGAGDAHLIALEILHGLDPLDLNIHRLLTGLKDSSRRYDEETAQITDEQKKKQYQEYKAESIYRDAGKIETDAYEKLIKERYGEQYFDQLWNANYEL
jgi:hypothetical protein